MAHYAFIIDGIVTEVITGIDETETIERLDTETWYSNFRGQMCKRTSFNNRIRFNYASIGYTYDEGRDAFIPPKPYTSWVLNESTCLWQAPVTMPAAELESNQYYFWNESIVNWEVKTTI